MESGIKTLACHPSSIGMGVLMFLSRVRALFEGVTGVGS